MASTRLLRVVPTFVPAAIIGRVDDDDGFRCLCVRSLGGVLALAHFICGVLAWTPNFQYCRVIARAMERPALRRYSKKLGT